MLSAEELVGEYGRLKLSFCCCHGLTDNGVGEVLKMNYKEALVSALLSLNELRNTDETGWSVHLAMCGLQLETNKNNAKLL